jgi:hypothetical protein
MKDAIYSHDIEFLKKAAVDLEAAGLPTLAGVLRRFLSRLPDLEDHHENSYSEYQMVETTCPTCRAGALDLQWQIIHAARRPDLRNSLLSGGLASPECHRCGARFPRSAPLLYCDPGHDLYLLLWPDLDEEGEKHLREATDAYLGDLPTDLRGGRPNLMFASRYFPKWSNADQTVIVSRVRSNAEFQTILRRAYSDPPP